MSVAPNKVKVIVITGASSGIGRALAELYAKSGVVLCLTGQNEQRLKEISDICSAKGARVISGLIDVTDAKAMEEWLLDIDDKHAVDIIIANAGISAGTNGNTSEDPEQVKRVFGVNLYGVLNTISPLQNRMIERQSGSIVIMSSLAGYRGWPGAPAYCGSKAAVKIYGESLRNVLSKSNVYVNVVCPGFVKSRMTDANEFKMPFLMDTDKAARIIAKGIENNKGRIAFPAMTTFIAWFFMVLPDFMSHYLLSNSPSKS